MANEKYEKQTAQKSNGKWKIMVGILALVVLYMWFTSPDAGSAGRGDNQIYEMPTDSVIDDASAVAEDAAGFIDTAVQKIETARRSASGRTGTDNPRQIIIIRSASDSDRERSAVRAPGTGGGTVGYSGSNNNGGKDTAKGELIFSPKGQPSDNTTKSRDK